MGFGHLKLRKFSACNWGLMQSLSGVILAFSATRPCTFVSLLPRDAVIIVVLVEMRYDLNFLL